MTKASNERGEIPGEYQNDIKFIDPEDLIEFKGSPELEKALAAQEAVSEDQNLPEQPAEHLPLPPTPSPSSTQYSDVPLTKEVASDYALKRREDTRGTLALVYTVSTFIIFGLGMLIAVIDALIRNVSIVDNLKEILPLISGIFLSSLGFVLGYYFRKSEDK